MRSLSRVVWSEGMHLAQHHFQVQSRYFEDSVAFALSSLFFEPWGLVGCELDGEALRNGSVALVHARGVMPDGLPFQFPDEPAPEPLEVAELFSPTQDRHLVLLTIPAYRAGQANSALNGGDAPDARYRPESRAVLDETTGRDEKPVALGRKNFRLRLDTGEVEGEVALPLARVRRDGSGHFVYDEEFIPPVLRIGASARLTSLLERLVEMLDARAGTLRGAEGEGSPAERASGELAGLWFAHAVHSALGPLQHHLRVRQAHPEVLFREMSRLAGALCTFAMEAHPRDLPRYDHRDLEASFGGLDRHIRAHLDVIVPTGRITVPLRRTDEYLFTGSVSDSRCFGSSDWFLGVRSSATEAAVVSGVPRLVKVCSAKHIARLVREAYPGLELKHVPSPPPEIAPRIGTHYFRVSRTEPCWGSIADTGEVGVYAPAALPDAQLDLSILLESS